MEHRRNFSFACVAAFTMLFAVACNEDHGNYTYLPDDEIATLRFDTTGMSYAERMVFVSGMYPGDTVNFPLKVEYDKPEQLRFRWYVNKYPYQMVREGNTMVYPKADTIAYTLELDNWICDLEPGDYEFHCLAEDTVRGMRMYYAAQDQSVKVFRTGQRTGLYLLAETTDGNTDIEVMTNGLLLSSYGDPAYKYFSSTYGYTLPGKPRFIRGCATARGSTKDCILVATDQNMYRLDRYTSLNPIDDYGEMFLALPQTYNPQAFTFTTMSNGNFLINDGKLYAYYADEGGKKFMDYYGGDYEADNYLIPVRNKLEQVIYDKKNHRFMKLSSKSSSSLQQLAQPADSYVRNYKVNPAAMPADPAAIITAWSNRTIAIVPEETGWFAHIFNFYSGNENIGFAGYGTTSRRSLANCSHIQTAKYFASANTYGSALYYADDDGCYSTSFTTSTVPAENKLDIYLEAGYKITAIYVPGSRHSSTNRYQKNTLVVASYNEATRDGRVDLYIVNQNSGKLDVGALSAARYSTKDGAHYNWTTGFGKVVGMCYLNAE